MPFGAAALALPAASRVESSHSILASQPASRSARRSPRRLRFASVRRVPQSPPQFATMLHATGRRGHPPIATIALVRLRLGIRLSRPLIAGFRLMPSGFGHYSLLLYLPYAYGSYH